MESYKMFREVSVASRFLEARVSGARPVMTVGECRVESISNMFVLFHSLLWKAKVNLDALSELSRLLILKHFVRGRFYCLLGR